MRTHLLLCVICLVCLAHSAFAEHDNTKQLVSNPNFISSRSGEMPDGWTVWRPEWEKAACTIRSTAHGLLITGEDPYAVGGLTQQIKNIEAGKAYAIKALCEFRDCPAPYQSVLVRVSWMRGDRLLHRAGMLVRGPTIDGRLGRFEDVLVAPENANVARLSLEAKWLRGGSVLFKNVTIQPTEKPRPRKVKVGTVYLRPSNSTPAKNLELWCEQIDAAGKLGLDIVCLGEAILTVGTGCSLIDCAEPIPGPSTERLGRAARDNNIWVVAGLTEKVGDIVYNTAVLLDRDGQIAGKYRKVHLPREEWKKGVRPGGEYPVFETDFGKVAIQICYDWFFPEPQAIFALRGAEIIFAPTWGNTLPDKDGCVDGRNVFRVRARDNGVYMVPCVYDGASLVIDPMGRVLADNKGKQGVFWAEIDLNKREPLDWVGCWRSIAPRHRMIDTYAPLLDAPQESQY